MLYYVSKYCTKAETKTIKLEDIMKDLISHMSLKNSMCLLVAKFINKLIEKKDILAQKACHLLLHLDLTSSSRLVAGLNV